MKAQRVFELDKIRIKEGDARLCTPSLNNKNKSRSK